jgi:MscS family membrane protein
MGPRAVFNAKGGTMVFLRVLIVTCVASFLSCQAAAQETGQEPATGVLDRILEQTEDDIIPIQTESPRSTLQTLYRLRDELEISIGAYWQEPSTSNAAQIAFVMEQLRALIDLSQLPLASRRETGSDTVLYLLDILGRVNTIAASRASRDGRP